MPEGRKTAVVLASGAVALGVYFGYKYYVGKKSSEKTSKEIEAKKDIEAIEIEAIDLSLYLNKKDNPEAAQLALANFQRSVADLKTQYINSYSDVRDTRVNFGGGGSVMSNRMLAVN